MANPFHESSPEAAAHPPDASGDITLMLRTGKGATLNLGTDSLLVLEDEPVTKRTSSCGLPLKRRARSPTKSIPYSDILWVSHMSTQVTITYAVHPTSSTARPILTSYQIDKTALDNVETWVARLLSLAYGKALLHKRIKVIINPFGGQGKAAKYYLRDIEPIFAGASCTISVEQTEYHGHGVEIAQALDVEAWDVVACCSGDGVPYEVFNGLAKKPNAAYALSKIAVVQLPCGSGNSMSLNLAGTDSPSLAALRVVKGVRTPLDLMSITQGDQRTLSFLSQSYGQIAESDLATEHLRWMGAERFTYGMVTRILRKATYPCDIAICTAIKDKEDIKSFYLEQTTQPIEKSWKRPAVGEDAPLPPLRFGTINDPIPESWETNPEDKMAMFIAGTMAYLAPDTKIFPASLPYDGHIDLVRMYSDVPRLQAFKCMGAVANDTWFQQKYVSYEKVVAYRLIPKNQEDGYISIDGERVPFQPFQVEIHQGLGTVLSCNGLIYEAKGP
ncbi:sphingoid long chain base kinase 4 [Eremomyces bilateralis CBS 781.70]|uniref:Sphingoid long chain base kinase 4 n=1 Tax=Eremomyces bilateralis CBS 781.70 TaxID=1392243 RepID=A0A6G1GHI4_9PEZI|nr:sphingoid long chain base kinase 4 [Eremomyces bilateralis CBS 781.70]KAF1817330.1 sphingoid long chain base kinase 4 [Eremomyces bilateralis CBS 781.70]